MPALRWLSVASLRQTLWGTGGSGLLHSFVCVVSEGWGRREWLTSGGQDNQPPYRKCPLLLAIRPPTLPQPAPCPALPNPTHIPRPALPRPMANRSPYLETKPEVREVLEEEGFLYDR